MTDTFMSALRNSKWLRGSLDQMHTTMVCSKAFLFFITPPLDNGAISLCYVVDLLMVGISESFKITSLVYRTHQLP